MQVYCMCYTLPSLYRHEAERLEQKAKGALERQKITDEAEAERARKELLELQANSAAVESTGQAKAEAQSRAEAAKIEGQAAVEQARLKAQASKIEAVGWTQHNTRSKVNNDCNYNRSLSWNDSRLHARQRPNSFGNRMSWRLPRLVKWPTLRHRSLRIWWMPLDLRPLLL